MTPRVLTIQQPWADAVLTPDGKDVENRGTGFPKGYTGPLLIHAGLRWSRRGHHDARIKALWSHPDYPYAITPPFAGDPARYDPERNYAIRHGVPYNGLPPKGYHGTRPFIVGAVLGVAQLVDAHLEHGGCCQPWGEAEYLKADGTRQGSVTHLVLAEPRRLHEPVPCPGRLGLWTPDDALLDAVRAQLTEPGF